MNGCAGLCGGSCVLLLFTHYQGGELVHQHPHEGMAAGHASGFGSRRGELLRYRYPAFLPISWCRLDGGSSGKNRLPPALFCAVLRALAVLIYATRAVWNSRCSFAGCPCVLFCAEGPPPRSFLQPAFCLCRPLPSPMPSQTTGSYAEFSRLLQHTADGNVFKKVR